MSLEKRRKDMKINNLINRIRNMGLTPYLGDEENYYVRGKPNVRIHFDTETGEVYPLRSDANGYYPISISQLLSLLR